MNNNSYGKLYLVATPIGNLSDMSPRAIDTLRAVDLIAAEDTRNTIKLLNHFEIKVPMTSYHEYNRIEKALELIEKMQAGADVALVTDAGMPAISDPGEDIVKLCYEAGIEVTVVPGPCAAVSALAISGLSSRRFVFEGFLPSDKKEREERLDELKSESRTMIIYEAPHRLAKTLKLLAETFGAERRISIVRELTKIHEEVIRMTLGEALKLYDEEGPRGEFVLIIEGVNPELKKKEQSREWESMSIKDHVLYYINQGNDKKQAMKLVAAERGIGKRDVYKECIEDE